MWSTTDRAISKAELHARTAGSCPAVIERFTDQKFGNRGWGGQNGVLGQAEKQRVKRDDNRARALYLMRVERVSFWHHKTTSLYRVL